MTRVHHLDLKPAFLSRFNDAFTNVVQKRLNIQSRYKYGGLHTEQLSRHTVVKGEHLLISQASESVCSPSIGD